MFDDDFIYVSCRCWDSAPPEQWTANEMRRDTSQLRQNDMFGVLFDTFHDRRNGFNFYTNPLGAFADQAITDEGNPNVDWNPVWQVRTGRFEGGWTVEIAIPFKSLRYRSGTDQTWGIQLRRGIRRKNELAHLTTVPASTGGSQGIFRVSAGATLVGLDLPPASKNLELKPYAISKLDDRRGTRARHHERLRSRRRRRREIRRDGQPDGRPHDQHRLRAGRSRRAAGQPHALQPPVSREARVLPRRPRDLRLRARAPGRAPATTAA